MNRNSDKRRNPKGFTISKINVIFLCFAFLLSSFSMFVLGIFVGRGQAPVTFKINDIKAEIAAVDTSQKKVEDDIVIVNEAEDKKSEEKPAFVAKAKNEIKKPEKPKQEEKPKPVRKKEEVINDSFSIQVGAFRFENDADALVSKLKAEKLPAFKYVSGNTKDVWYRVRVGSFKTREDAKKLLIKLKDKKYDAFLVK